MIAILPTGLDNRTFFVDFSREITEKGFKRTKKVENGWKSSSTSFWVRSAPKSWLKYTTRGNLKLSDTQQMVKGLHKKLLFDYILGLGQKNGSPLDDLQMRIKIRLYKPFRIVGVCVKFCDCYEASNFYKMS